MAEAKGNTAVPAHGDHDRVQMLSLRADGTPDQSPGVEMIGDRETALEQTREQFRQQAVSAVDQAERGAVAPDGVVEDAPQDPAIAALQEKHEAAESAADSAAESTVAELFVDEPGTSGKPADKPKPAPGPASK